MNRVLSPKARTAMEIIMGSALLLSPLYVPRSQRRYTAIPMLVGAAGLLTTLIAEAWGCDNSGFRPSRDLSEAVADPDNHRMPQFAHAE